MWIAADILSYLGEPSNLTSPFDLWLFGRESTETRTKTKFVACGRMCRIHPEKESLMKVILALQAKLGRDERVRYLKYSLTLVLVEERVEDVVERGGEDWRTR